MRTSEKNLPDDGAGAGAAVEIGPLRNQEDARAFRTLNEEWITRYFSLEAKDVETLADPENTIVGKGGRVYLARSGGAVVGCVALMAIAGGVYELSKMAVAPSMRGRGLGRMLLKYAIAEARTMGARSLFLGSNRKLQDAVHLYESAGFQHVAAERVPVAGYVRANVVMEMIL